MMKTHTHAGHWAAALAMALALLAGASRSLAADCMDLLDNKTYSCSIKREDGAVFKENCFQFTVPGEGPGDFDLTIEDSSFPLTCDCRADGSFAHPKFGKSDSFHCITKLESSPTSIIALEGKLVKKGAKIKDGNWLNTSGDTLIFECVEDPTCSLVPTGASASTDNPF